MTSRTRRKLQTLTAAAIAITAIILLTGCAGGTAAPATRSECADADGYGPRECTITLKDTRRITCIEDAGPTASDSPATGTTPTEATTYEQPGTGGAMPPMRTGEKGCASTASAGRARPDCATTATPTTASAGSRRASHQDAATGGDGTPTSANGDAAVRRRKRPPRRNVSHESPKPRIIPNKTVSADTTYTGLHTQRKPKNVENTDELTSNTQLT